MSEAPRRLGTQILVLIFRNNSVQCYMHATNSLYLVTKGESKIKEIILNFHYS